MRDDHRGVGRRDAGGERRPRGTGAGRRRAIVRAAARDSKARGVEPAGPGAPQGAGPRQGPAYGTAGPSAALGRDGADRPQQHDPARQCAPQRQTFACSFASKGADTTESANAASPLKLSARTTASRRLLRVGLNDDGFECMACNGSPTRGSWGPSDTEETERGGAAIVVEAHRNALGLSMSGAALSRAEKSKTSRRSPPGSGRQGL